MAYLVKKVHSTSRRTAESKDEQLHLQAVVLDKAKQKGAAKRKKVGNGWILILYMRQCSLEKNLGVEFENLEAFLE